jgi:hypothetical protein
MRNYYPNEEHHYHHHSSKHHAAGTSGNAISSLEELKEHLLETTCNCRQVR